MSENGLRKLFRINKIKMSMSVSICVQYNISSMCCVGIIRSSSDWIHINETSIECGSQSRSWINIKTKTKQKNTHKQTKKNVKNKTKIIIHTVTLPGIVYVEKNYCDPFPVIFFLPTQQIDVSLICIQSELLLIIKEWL
jgi:hypothetical protein